jgi:hypothetical protein
MPASGAAGAWVRRGDGEWEVEYKALDDDDEFLLLLSYIAYEGCYGLHLV